MKTDTLADNIQVLYTSPEIVPGPTVTEKCPDTTRKDRSELRVDG